MATTAFLFPGQGSQYAGMGSDLYAEIDEARDRIDEADRVLGFALSAAMFGAGDGASDEETLRRTDITQPALYVHSMAVHAALEARGIGCDMAAGHSLGEYAALAAARAIDFDEGLRIVRLRGRLMAEAGERRPGTMAAVIGMDDHDVEAVCAAASGDGVVQCANFNSPGQVVISGDAQAVARAMALASERGARKVIELPVSGAFHSPLMAHARDGLAEALGELTIRRPRVPVYLNVTAEPESDPEAIRQRLLEQLLAPVRWAQSLEAMRRDGADTFVEIGAGRVLSGLVKRTLGREATTLAIGTVDDLSTLTEED